MKRTVFFVSESTGITAQTLGHSLLSQFEDLAFERISVPYVNTEARARALVQRFQEAAERDGIRPLVFSTLLDERVRRILQGGNCYFLEVYEGFLAPLSRELGIPPSRRTGRSHAITEINAYTKRIEAIQFAMANDDGIRPDRFPEADLILIGVSRSGKTPTCLYLAVNFGLRAANYPLTEEDFARDDVPRVVWRVRSKLFGLHIDPQRLQRYRQARRPDSPYATLARCQGEVRQSLHLFRRLGIPVLDTTNRSLEELAAHLLESLKDRLDAEPLPHP